MKITCPHCSQVLELEPEVLAALQGQPHFACPVCEGLIAVPASPGASRGSRRSAAHPSARAHRGLNRNLLVLGVVTLMVLGGVAVLLASKNGGNIFNLFQNITQQIINNSYFTQLIADGVTTKQDLEAIAEIRPYGDGFIGVSKEALEWEGARALAAKCGAQLLPQPMENEEKVKLSEWVTATFDESSSAAAWVQQWGGARLFSDGEFREVSLPEGEQLALLQWMPGSGAADRLAKTTDNPADAGKDRPFANSLGMTFVPVPGTNVLFCTHETRRRDYAEYSKAVPKVDRTWVGHNGYKIPEAEKPDHAVFYVSLMDARAFCEWLSLKEGRRYRLPKDREWSFAVGIGADEASAMPQSLSGKIADVYPWGQSWPPPHRSANFADLTFAGTYPKSEHVERYDDEFVYTAPVQSFAPNQLGIHDLGGNVWEWCDDDWSGDGKEAPTRGGSWRISEREQLLSSNRHPWHVNGRGISTGFRIVLEMPGESTAEVSPASAPRPDGLLANGEWQDVLGRLYETRSRVVGEWTRGEAGLELPVAVGGGVIAMASAPLDRYEARVRFVSSRHDRIRFLLPSPASPLPFYFSPYRRTYGLEGSEALSRPLKKRTSDGVPHEVFFSVTPTSLSVKLDGEVVYEMSPMDWEVLPKNGKPELGVFLHGGTGVVQSFEIRIPPTGNP